MTKVISATWVTSSQVWDMDTAPMFSRSEADDVVQTDTSHWEFELPSDYKLFPTAPAVGDGIPVVGEKDGQQVLVGWACPVFYTCSGYSFHTWAEYEREFPLDHPVIVREQDLSATLADQESEGYYD